MEISIEMIKTLRERCGAGVMDCRNALAETGGDAEKALLMLREKGLHQAKKKAERVTAEGLIEAYVHNGGRIGAIVELNCETDFAARTDEFKELAHNLAMQIAAQAPQCIDEADLPEGTDVEPGVACLLLQPYIRDPGLTIRDLITEAIAKVGENIRVSRFSRFELGN